MGREHRLVEGKARFRSSSFPPFVVTPPPTTALVTSLDDAVTLARRYARRPRFVTLQGDVMESYGAMTGGRVQGSGAVLGLAADLEEAEVAARDAQREAAAQREAVTRLQVETKDASEGRRAGADTLAHASEALRRAREQAAARGGVGSCHGGTILGPRRAGRRCPRELVDWPA